MARTDTDEKRPGDPAMIERIEQETSDFIAEHLRLFKKMWERERSLDELDCSVEKLQAKSTAFSRSIKSANSRMRNRCIRNLVALCVFLALVVTLIKVA